MAPTKQNITKRVREGPTSTSPTPKTPMLSADSLLLDNMDEKFNTLQVFVAAKIQESEATILAEMFLFFFIMAGLSPYYLLNLFMYYKLNNNFTNLKN